MPNEDEIGAIIAFVQDNIKAVVPSLKRRSLQGEYYKSVFPKFLATTYTSRMSTFPSSLKSQFGFQSR